MGKIGKKSAKNSLRFRILSAYSKKFLLDLLGTIILLLVGLVDVRIIVVHNFNRF